MKVPQGYVLSPMLFAICLSNIEMRFNQCKYYRFSSDTIVYLDHNDIET